MASLQAIIADAAEGGDADVEVGNPTFEFVMIAAMEKITNADGSERACGFDGDEGGLVVHDVVGEEDFFATAAAHVAGGVEIERARSSHAGEEPGVLLVPEAVRGWQERRRGCLCVRRALRLRFVRQL